MLLLAVVVHALEMVVPRSPNPLERPTDGGIEEQQNASGEHT